MISMKHFVITLAIGLGFSAVHAQDLFIYPAQGQSADQQRQDRLECHLWAVDQTGFDPTDPANFTVPGAGAPLPQVERQGARTSRSVVRGAAVGTAGGAIAGDVGRGAAIGATSGALIGGARSADQRRGQQQATDDWARQQQSAQWQQQQALQQRQQGFNRAMRVCLEARGYTVS